MSALNKENNISDHEPRKLRSSMGGTSELVHRASQVVIQRNPCNLVTIEDEATLEQINDKKIGKWNIRSLFKGGKTDNVIIEMQRFDVSILGCSEVRGPSYWQCRINDHKVYYSGDTSIGNSNEVTIIENREVQRCVLGFRGISDRVNTQG